MIIAIFFRNTTLIAIYYSIGDILNLTTDNLINDLERWFNLYKNHINSLSYAKNTIILYNSHIDYFIEYMRQYQDDTTMKDIKTVHLTNFLYYVENLNLKKRKNRNHSKSTKDSYIKSIRSFFTFISDNNEELYTYDKIFKNLYTTDTSQQQDKIVHLNDDEVIKLMNTLQRQKSASKNSHIAFRNSLLIKLMLYGGLRISEALELSMKDIVFDLQRNLYVLNIIGKGSKKQTAHISVDIIDDELCFYKELNYSANKFLFTTSSGKQLKRDEAYRIVNSIYKKALISKTGLHILRHTFAMRLTQNGESPFVIQRLLRHNSLATTTVYAKANISDMGQALSKLH